MVILQIISELVDARLKRVLDAAALALPPGQFMQYRRIVLDEFGRRGLLKDLSIPDQLRQMRDWCNGQGLAVTTEYVEPGASATDDRRPVFQQMIADATLEASPYEAIIVHSRSRFFRD